MTPTRRQLPKWLSHTVEYKLERRTIASTIICQNLAYRGKKLIEPTLTRTTASLQEPPRFELVKISIVT